MIPDDPYAYPGSDTLINNFDIRDFAKAKAAEYKFSAARELELAANPIQGKFDLAHLKAIHGHLFQDMYSWAGKVRDIDFAMGNKETGLVNQFLPKMVMDIKSEDFNKLASTFDKLQDMAKPAFVRAVSEIHTQLDALHLFRDGNGRAVRVFVTDLARKAGFDLDLEKIPVDRWKLASHMALPRLDPKNPEASHVANQSDKRQVFHESLTPTLAKAFVTIARAEAVVAFPVLQHAYERLDSIKAMGEKMPGKDTAARLVEAERSRMAAKLKAGASPESLINPYLRGKAGLQPAYQAIKAATLSASKRLPASPVPEKTPQRGMRM